ncbi:MAG: hypothetical protein ABSB19_19160 [Methylomonas sp.]
MQENFVLWPKQDRRKSDGNFDRRQLDRRNQSRDPAAVRSALFSKRSNSTQPSSNLTDEEIQYIMELYNEE